MNSPTPDALRAALAAMRNRPTFMHWPAEFEQVMADPIRGRLVRLEATGRARARPPAPRPYQARPTPVPIPSLPSLFDRKRAAAGERDDE